MMNMMNIINFFRKMDLEIKWQDEENKEMMTTIYKGRPIFYLHEVQKDMNINKSNGINYFDSRVVL